MTKKFTADLELQKSGTIVSPSIGFLTIGAKTDNKVYIKDSNGIESQLATTAQLNNYLPLSGGTLTGFVQFNTCVEFRGAPVIFSALPNLTGCQTQYNLGVNENNQLGIICSGSGGGAYLPLSGGTVTGNLSVNGTTTLNAVTKVGTTLVTNLNADLLDGNHASAFSLSNHNHEAQYEPIIGLSSARLMGRYTAGAGTWQQITVGSGLNLSTGGVLTATGGGDYDNYQGYNLLVNNGLQGLIPSVNASSGYYGGVNFQAGNGIAIQATSISGNKLQLQFVADYSGLNIPIANTASQVTLSSDFTLSLSTWANNITTISLPSAGTYLVQAKVFTTQTGNVSSAFRLAIGTTYYDYAIMPSENPTGTGTQSNTVILQSIITVGSSATVTLGGYTVNSGIVVKASMSIGGVTATGLTKISYVKIA